MVSQLSNKLRYPKLINTELDNYLLKKNLIPVPVKRSANKEFIYFSALLISALFLFFTYTVGNLSDNEINCYSIPKRLK